MENRHCIIIIHILFPLWTTDALQTQKSTSYSSLLYISLFYLTSYTTTGRWTASQLQLHKQNSFSSLLLFIHSCYSPISNDHDLLSFSSKVVANLTLGPIIFLSMCQPSNDLSVPRAQWSKETLVSVWRGEMVGERCGKTAKVLAAEY